MTVRNDDGTYPEGVSGNPNGRPTGSVNIKTLLTALLDRDIVRLDWLADNKTITPKQANILEHMNSGLIAKALGEQGDLDSIDLKAIDMIYDRLEGKALAKHQEVPTTLEDALNELEKEE